MGKVEVGVAPSSAFGGLFLNIDTPIRFSPCGLHVIIMWYHTISNYCCVCVAMPKRSIVMTITWYAASCTPQKALYVYQTLSLFRVGSGNETKHVAIIVWSDWRLLPEKRVFFKLPYTMMGQLYPWIQGSACMKPHHSCAATVLCKSVVQWKG